MQQASKTAETVASRSFESGYGVVRLSSVLPFEVISVNPLVEELLEGTLKPGVSLLERIAADEVQQTTKRLQDTLSEDLPVRMENHFTLDDGRTVAMNGWCHNIVGDADPQELCYILVPEEGDEDQLRSVVREAHVQAFSMTYDNIYEISNDHTLIRCVKATPLLPSLASGGMRLSFPDVINSWLEEAVIPEDREAVRRFFISSLDYREENREPRTRRREFRVWYESSIVWCEGALVPLFEDEFLFCCRDISSHKGYDELEDERDTLQNEGRSLRAALSAGASLSMVFDVETGARIHTEDDIDMSGEPSIETLDEFVAVLRKRTRDDGLPAQVLDGSYVKGLDNKSAADNTLRLQWKMWDHAGAYRLFEAGFLNVKTVGGGSDRLFVVIKDVERNGAGDFWEAGLKESNETVGVLSKKGFEHYCLHRRAHAPADEHGFLFAIEIDDFWNYLIDEQEEMLQVLAESLGSLGKSSDVRVARVLRPLFAVCIHGVDDAETVEAYGQMLKRRADAALAAAGEFVVSVGYAPCNHDPERGYHACFERANRALRTAQKTGGNQVIAYRDEMARDGWLKELDLPVTELGRHVVRVRTFGFFEVFVDDVPVLFTREKAKELLALLVDRRGGFVSSRDAIACLWEDEQVNKVTLSRFRKVAMHLKDTLEEYGIEDIVVNENGRRRLDVSKVECDLFEYLSGEKRYERLFQGAYLLNYSWSEATTGQLMFEREHRGVRTR